MIRLLLCLTCLLLAAGGFAAAQTTRSNPRPQERPSRTVEELLKRRAAPETTGGAGQSPATPATPSGGSPAANESRPAAAPAPASTKPSVFRVTGAEAWEVARRAGWRFFPKGARGALDGVNTVAEIQPGIPLSMIQGPVLTQRRTPAGWGKISQNTFYLFSDARGRARNLADGWRVQDLRLSGDPFSWVFRPQPGGTSPSLAIQLAGGRNAQDSVVRLDGMVLQGPPGATDWRVAFGAQ